MAREENGDGKRLLEPELCIRVKSIRPTLEAFKVDEEIIEATIVSALQTVITLRNQGFAPNSELVQGRLGQILNVVLEGRGKPMEM